MYTCTSTTLDSHAADDAMDKLVKSSRRIAKHVLHRPFDGALDWEDLAQEACCRMLRTDTGLRAHQPGSYLYSVVKRASMDQCRGARRRTRREEEWGQQARTGDGRIQEHALARRVLDTLPPADRRVLERIYIDGMPYAQLALEAGIGCATLRSRVSRLLQSLRRSLDPGASAPDLAVAS